MCFDVKYQADLNSQVHYSTLSQSQVYRINTSIYIFKVLYLLRKTCPAPASIIYVRTKIEQR